MSTDNRMWAVERGARVVVHGPSYDGEEIHRMRDQYERAAPGTFYRVGVWAPAPPSTLSCTTTDDSGDAGWVPLRDDTVSSAQALEMMLTAAERWDQPLCPACQQAPTLVAGREDPEDEERMIPLDHDDPAVETRHWFFGSLAYREYCGCPTPRAKEADRDR
jgi:hypothetical protein